MQSVKLSEAAARELDDAYHWYEDQQAGLGDELLGEFLDATRRISENPQLYPVVEGDVRRAPLRRFPYALFYRREVGGIVVLAVFHGRRSPVHWKSRIDG